MSKPVELYIQHGCLEQFRFSVPFYKKDQSLRYVSADTFVM